MRSAKKLKVAIDSSRSRSRSGKNTPRKLKSELNVRNNIEIYAKDN